MDNQNKWRQLHISLHVYVSITTISTNCHYHFYQKVVPSWCSNCFFFVSYVLQKHVILAEGVISILNSRKVCFLTEPITSIRFLRLTTQMCQQNIFVPKDGYTFYAAKSRVMAVWALNNISVKSSHTFLNAITQTEEEWKPEPVKVILGWLEECIKCAL